MRELVLCLIGLLLPMNVVVIDLSTEKVFKTTNPEKTMKAFWSLIDCLFTGGEGYSRTYSTAPSPWYMVRRWL